MKEIYIKRTHGLGNVIMLLPVLLELVKNGNSVILVTKKEWCFVFSTIFPQIQFISHTNKQCIDLDKFTIDSMPSMHRTKEFALILGVNTYSPLKITPPLEWLQEFNQFKDCILLAPEANHKARNWSADYIKVFCELVDEHDLVLVGLNKEKQTTRNHTDLRGQLSLKGLIGLISICRGVIAVDSAILQIAMALDKKCISIFSTISPQYRINPGRKVLSIQADLDCCPCNKNEVCNQEYYCIQSITPEIVVDNIEHLDKLKSHRIKKIEYETTYNK